MLTSNRRTCVEFVRWDASGQQARGRVVAWSTDAVTATPPAVETVSPLAMPSDMDDVSGAEGRVGPRFAKRVHRSPFGAMKNQSIDLTEIGAGSGLRRRLLRGRMAE